MSAASAAEVADAYVWGLPLVTMHRTCAAHGGVRRGMSARGQLATAADRTVVAPNNDTLYASGWFDLRAGDLVVDVGAMDTPDRYWSVMLLDAYTDVTYICRRLHGTAGTHVRITCNPRPGRAGTAEGGGSSAGLEADDLPVRRLDGTADAVGRPTGTRDDVRADAGGPMDAAAPRIGRTSPPPTPLAVPPVPPVPPGRPGPSGAPGVAGGGATGGAAAPGVPGRPGAGVGVGGARGRAGGVEGVVAVGTATVWVLVRVLVAGPDDLVAARGALARIRVEQRFWRRTARDDELPAARTGERFLGELRAALAVDPPAPWHPAPPAGLDGLLREPPAPDVVAAGIERGKIVVARSGGVDRWGNGWGTRSRGARFGDDVAYRAAFARVSLAGHLPDENRSYTRAFDGSAPATLRFPAGGEPPVDGFWSLCVYGPDLFFVDNALGRYSIGDRTPGLRRDPDGGLTITLGADRPPGPAVANWLPTPAGPCFLSLRAYEGRPAVVDATWFPPDLESLS